MNKNSKFFLPNLFLLALLSTFIVACTPKKTQQAQTPTTTNEQTTESLEVSHIEGNHYIAIAAPLTGPYSELGQTILAGANLAVEEFNSSEASPEHKIGTLVIDDGGIVSEGIARTGLIKAEEALGVIGHLNSEVSAEVASIYARAGIPMISPASTNPKVTERASTKGFVFRTIGTDRQIGEVAAEYVNNNKDFKRIAVLYNDRAYGISVASEFVREIARNKEKKLVFYQTIPVRTNDHSESAEKVARTKADLVFFVGEYNDAGYLLKDLKKKLPNVVFLGAEGVHQQEFINIAKASAEGALVIGTSPADEKLSQQYNAKYNKPVSGYVGTSYNATKILLEAIKANNYKDSSKVATSIQKNPIFDPNGDLINPNFVIYKVQNSEFELF